MDSGTTAVDNGGDNGSIWTTILANAGSIFTGGAALVNAFNKTTPTTTVVTPPPGASNNTGLSGIWIWVLAAVAIIVVLFLILKK